MAAANIIVPDMEPTALNNWQLAKQISTAQTVITAAKLSQTLKDASYDEAIDALDVSSFGAIRIQLWGEGDNNDAPVVNLYGWSRGGPGFHIGTITTTMGNFTSAASTGFHASEYTHKSIRNEFAAATAYRGVDGYTETNDFEGAITVQTSENDFPASFDVSFAGSQHEYFAILVTDLGTPTATNLGAIFKVISIKKSWSVPQFTA